MYNLTLDKRSFRDSKIACFCSEGIVSGKGSETTVLSEKNFPKLNLQLVFLIANICAIDKFAQVHVSKDYSVVIA